MRQAADGGLPGFRQKTPDTHGETSTLSEINIAPTAFNLNQSNAVCLPLVSDSKRLIWVHSNQFKLQLDGTAELDRAFNRFPYLTQNETAALAQRCSLHPDQVKVWFMVQRLHYGISWDYKDILKVQRKLKSSRGTRERPNDRGENNKWKREVKGSGGKKAGEVREEQSANEGRMIGENIRANERLERKTKQEQPMKEEDRKVEELEEDKRHTQKKRKRVAVTDKVGKKGRVDDDGVVERAGEVEITKSKSTQSQTTLFTRKKKKAKANKTLLSIQDWPAHKSFVVPDEALDVCPPLIPLSPTQVFNMPPLTDSQTPKYSLPLKLEGELHAESRGCTRIRCNTKTNTQLAMMKVAFSRCQYPDTEGYNRLAMLIGVPRHVLVQWFGDMRYYVKKGKPYWMNQEEHSKALANIKYRQCLKTLERAQPSEGDREATWKMKLERSESCGKAERVQVPPE